MSALSIPFVEALLERISIGLEKELRENPTLAGSYNRRFIQSVIAQEMFTFPFENPEIEWIFGAFEDALYSRRDRIGVKASKTPEYREIVDELEEIRQKLSSSPETERMGRRLDELTGSLLSVVEGAYYKQGIRDGHRLAGITK
ncbi:MAG TPA: hypothetical protein DD789_00640 [Firmicutes bacterium]|jgi:hypothetical protein|nr:hypothetical protein [Bacillota bacterium]